MQRHPSTPIRSRRAGFGLLLAGAIAAAASPAFSRTSPADAPPNPLGGQDNPLARPRQAPAFYEGDGLIMSIERTSRDGKEATGRLSLGDRVFPHRTTIGADGSMRGTFVVGESTFEFTGSKTEGGGIVLESGGATYRLKKVDRPSRPFPGAGAPVTSEAPGASEAPGDARTPATGGLVGTWTGTGKEEADDGTTRELPIRVVVSRSADGSYRAQVSSKLRAPDASGRLIDLEIEGRFSGSGTASGLELRAPEITMRIVETGATQSLGAQAMKLRPGSGPGQAVGEIGTEAEGWTRLELRREGAGESPRRVEPPAPIVTPRRDGAPVVLRPHEIHDPGLGNMKSHQLLVPEGWRVDGGVQWNPALFRDFVHLDLHVKGPDGAEFAVHPGGFWEWSNVYDQNIARGFMRPDQKPKPGQPLQSGMRFMPPPDTTGEYVQKMLIPAERPGALSVEIVEAKTMEEVLEARKVAFRQLIESVERNNAQARQLGQPGQDRIVLFADKVQATYEEGGRRFREDFLVLGHLQVSYNVIPGNNEPTAVVHWGIDDVKAVRAPASQAAAVLPVAESVALSLRFEPKWQAVILDLIARIGRQQMDALVKRGEIARRAREEAWERHQSTVRSREESMDRSHRQFRNYLLDLQDVKMPDGSTKQLPSTYDNMYSDGRGGVILSNDPVGDASQRGWTRLEPIR